PPAACRESGSPRNARPRSRPRAAPARAKSPQTAPPIRSTLPRARPPSGNSSSMAAGTGRWSVFETAVLAGTAGVLTGNAGALAGIAGALCAWSRLSSGVRGSLVRTPVLASARASACRAVSHRIVVAISPPPGELMFDTSHRKRHHRHSNISSISERRRSMWCQPEPHLVWWAAPDLERRSHHGSTASVAPTPHRGAPSGARDVADQYGSDRRQSDGSPACRRWGEHLPAAELVQRPGGNP